MSEVPPGCGPHQKAASFRLSPDFNIEQTFCYVEHVGTFNRQFLIRYIDLFAALPPARFIIAPYAAALALIRSMTSLIVAMRSLPLKFF